MDWPPEGLEFNTQGFPRVHQVNEYLPNPTRDKIRICRCWQSKKFPFCDDTHKQLVEAGDDVGPMVFVYRHNQRGLPPGSRYMPLSKMFQESSSTLGPAAGVGAVCFGLGLLAGMKSKNLFKGWFGGGPPGEAPEFFHHAFVTPDLGLDAVPVRTKLERGGVRSGGSSASSSSSGASAVSGSESSVWPSLRTVVASLGGGGSWPGAAAGSGETPQTVEVEGGTEVGDGDTGAGAPGVGGTAASEMAGTGETGTHPGAGEGAESSPEEEPGFVNKGR